MVGIEKIYNDNRYRNICKNICSRFPSISEDIFSETIILIIEKKVDLKTKTDNDIDAIFITICRNVLRDPDTQKKYNYKYNARFKKIIVENEMIDNSTQEIEISAIDYSEKIVEHKTDSKEDCYKKNLIRLWIKHGSCRKVSALTKIDYKTVYTDIKKFTQPK